MFGNLDRPNFVLNREMWETQKSSIRRLPSNLVWFCLSYQADVETRVCVRRFPRLSPVFGSALLPSGGLLCAIVGGGVGEEVWGSIRGCPIAVWLPVPEISI